MREITAAPQTIETKQIALGKDEYGLVVSPDGLRALAVARPGTKLGAHRDCTVLVGTQAEIQAEIDRRKADPKVKFAIAAEHEAKLAPVAAGS